MGKAFLLLLEHEHERPDPKCLTVSGKILAKYCFGSGPILLEVVYFFLQCLFSPNYEVFPHLTKQVRLIAIPAVSRLSK